MNQFILKPNEHWDLIVTKNNSLKLISFKTLIFAQMQENKHISHKNMAKNI